MSQYQTKVIAEEGAGEKSAPAPLDDLDKEIAEEVGLRGKKEDIRDAQVLARRAIEHFVAFCRKFLQEHPPETHIMLAQGFGVRLQGGYAISLTPTETSFVGQGQMEPTQSFAVTPGMSSPGMRGVEPSFSIGITGAPPSGLRGPGA